MVTWVFLCELGQSVLFVQRTGGVHFTFHGLIQTQLLFKTTVDPKTQNLQVSLSFQLFAIIQKYIKVEVLGEALTGRPV